MTNAWVKLAHACAIQLINRPAAGKCWRSERTFLRRNICIDQYKSLLAAAGLATLLALNSQTAPADTPPPDKPTPCSGVQIVQGMSADSIQGLVDANPAGAQFCFAPGFYLLNHYITLKDSNQFVCTDRRKCVLNGARQYRGALAGAYGTTRQRIVGFIVEQFIALPNTWPDAGLQVRDYGEIFDNEMRENQTGVSVGANVTVRSNYIHHNTVYGLSGGPGGNILIEDNELAWNNTSHQDPDNDAGGSKVIGSTAASNNLRWIHNWVHDNWGNGIWSDGNVRATYQYNTVENNGGAGIDHEISWDAVIDHNTVRNNNTFEQDQGLSCWHGAQIVLNNSQNVQITNNTVEAVGTNAICLANTTRKEPRVFPQALANISVTGNVIKLRGTVNVGVVGDRTPKKISFDSNTYYIDKPGASDWTYMNPMTFKQWQAAGFDGRGSVLPW